MFEIWKGTTGQKLELGPSALSLDRTWSLFMQELRDAKRADQGMYVELRRPDGSVFARCTMQLDATPDAGNIG